MALLEQLSSEETKLITSEYTIAEYIKTLKNESSRHSFAIQCDQGGTYGYKVMHACDHAVELLIKELEDVKDKKAKIYERLHKKYGEKGVDFIVTLAGTVESIERGAK